MSPRSLPVVLTFVGGMALGLAGTRILIPTTHATVTFHLPSSAATPVDFTVSKPSAHTLRGADQAEAKPEKESHAGRVAQGQRALEDLIVRLGLLPEIERGTAVTDFIYQMRALGSAGVQVLNHFLQRNEDLKLHPLWGFGDGKLQSAPTLRAAILDALNDLKDPAVTEISLRALRQTSSLIEATLAIRNLEKRSPGTYRAEALKTTLELIRVAPDKTSTSLDEMSQAWARGNIACELLRYFKSPEFLPVIEQELAKTGNHAHVYLSALSALNDTDRLSATHRLLTDSQLSPAMAHQGFVLLQLDWREPSIRQDMASLFANQMQAKDQDFFLTNFAQDGLSAGRGFIEGPGQIPPRSTEEKRERWEAKLEFLQQVALHANTPVLQQRISEARAQLQKALKQ